MDEDNVQDARRLAPGTPHRDRRSSAPSDPLDQPSADTLYRPFFLTAIAIVLRLRFIDPTGLAALRPTFVLLNLGCLLRVTLQVGTDWHPVCFNS